MYLSASLQQLIVAVGRHGLQLLKLDSLLRRKTSGALHGPVSHGLAQYLVMR
jgi:hypothetical protein